MIIDKKKLKILLLIIIYFFSANVLAVGSNDLKKDINDHKDKIKKIDKEIKEEQSRLSVVKNKEEKLKKNLEVLNKSQDSIGESINLTENNIKKIASEIKTLREKIYKKNKEIDGNKKIISSNLRIINKTQQVNPVLIFLSADKFSDFIDSMVFVNRINSVLESETKKIISEREVLEEYKKKEESNKKVLVSYRKDLDSQKRRLEETEKEKKELLVEVEKTKKEKEKIIAEKKLAKKQFEQQLFNLESKLPKVDISDVAKKSVSGEFIRPVVGGWISAEFGRKSAYHMRVYKDGLGHNGVDFAVSTGTKVMSVADGIVTDTGDGTKVCSGVQYGKWILIRHNNGTSSMYAHLSHIGVSKGQKVSKGQYIGKSGTTGFSTGPHLHVSMYATKAVQVKNIPHSYKGRCYNKIFKLPISPHSGYLDPFQYIPRK